MRHSSHPLRQQAFAAAALVAALTAGQTHAAVSLVGAQVSYDYVHDGGLLNSFAAQTIADGTTFTDSTNGLRSFVVGPSYVVIENTSPLAFGAYAFNGPGFIFSSGITGAVVDTTLTSPDFKGAIVSDNAGFAVNFSALAPSLGSSLFAEISGPSPLGGQTGSYQYVLPTAGQISGSQPPVTLVPTTYFLDNQDGILVALNANTITVLNTLPLAFAGGTFNGPELSFTGIDIAGATIDPISAPDFLGGVTHTQHGVAINFANLNPGLGHALVIDIDAATQGSSGAVPEPTSWALMIVGMGAVGGLLRRRRAAQACAA